MEETCLVRRLYYGIKQLAQGMGLPFSFEEWKCGNDRDCGQMLSKELFVLEENEAWEVVLLSKDMIYYK